MRPEERLRELAELVREVEDMLPTSCVWESERLHEIADDLARLRTEGEK